MTEREKGEALQPQVKFYPCKGRLDSIQELSATLKANIVMPARRPCVASRGVRQAMVIFVPPGAKRDKTRSPGFYEGVSQELTNLGRTAGLRRPAEFSRLPSIDLFPVDAAPPAGMQDREPDDLFAPVTHDDVVGPELAVGCLCPRFEVHVDHVRRLVIWSFRGCGLEFELLQADAALGESHRQLELAAHRLHHLA